MLELHGVVGLLALFDAEHEVRKFEMTILHGRQQLANLRQGSGNGRRSALRQGRPVPSGWRPYSKRRCATSTGESGRTFALGTLAAAMHAVPELLKMAAV